MRAARITVVLCGFRRPHRLSEQYAAIAAQTVPPAEVMVWNNFGGTKYASEFTKLRKILNRCTTVRSNRNLGVWARFAFALMAKTEFVCVIDDDTMPGRRWLENCLATMEQFEALLGTRGVIFRPGGCYRVAAEVGVFNPNEAAERVDVVTHNWFFRREWLSDYWRELPPTRFVRAGEDIHWSYTLQKYRDLTTVVPPHPEMETDLWGSHPHKALTYGGDAVGIFRQDGVGNMDEYLQSRVARGFRLLRASHVNREMLLTDLL